MRTSFFLSLATLLLCSGCVTRSTTPPAAFSATELSARTTGLRAPYAPSPVTSFQRTDGADPYTQPPLFRSGGDVVMGQGFASRKVPTNFTRTGGNVPAGVAVVHYTNSAGAQAALRGAQRLPRSADDTRAEVAGGFVSLNVKERYRGALPLLASSGRNYVVVSEAAEHFLAIRNTSSQAVEVVIAINGRDLIDGQSNSYGKRGYVIDGKASVSVAAPLDQATGEITMGVFTGTELR